MKAGPRSQAYAMFATECRLAGNTGEAEEFRVMSQEAFEWERYDGDKPEQKTIDGSRARFAKMIADHRRANLNQRYATFGAQLQAARERYLYEHFPNHGGNSEIKRRPPQAEGLDQQHTGAA